MKIVIPKIVVQVDMADYAPELQGQYLHVWVNPPMRVLETYRRLLTDLQANELASAQAALEAPVDEARSPLWKAFDQAKLWLKAKKEENATGVDPKLLGWYAEFWSHGPVDARWTLDELQALEQDDPSFLSWMIGQTWKARAEHLERKKKI